MAEKKQWARGVRSWIIDQLIDRWVAILSAIGTIAMTYVASISDLVGKYGLIAWFGVGLTGGLILAVILLVISKIRVNMVRASFAEKQAQTIAFNPLSKKFERQRLKLADFYHPFYSTTNNAKFDECELIGPAHVIFLDCEIRYCGFDNCEVVIVKENARIRGCAVFHECAFERSRFFSVTLYMPKRIFDKFKTLSDGSPPVISDGEAGNL